MSYCPICGNTGITIDNKPCSCRFNPVTFYNSVSCLDIPDQYRGITFNKSLVPQDIAGAEQYSDFLQGIYESVKAGQWQNKNIVIASPTGHSKSILAYSCIEALFRASTPTFPLYDLLELYRTVIDIDLGKQPTHEVENPERILTVPVLFVKIPRVFRYEIFDAFVMLLDRRVRRNNSTIFLYDGSWNQLIVMDKQNVLSGLMGDGSYGSVKVHSYNTVPRELPEVQFQANIG